jgi:hypothetical protein
MGKLALFSSLKRIACCGACLAQIRARSHWYLGYSPVPTWSPELPDAKEFRIVKGKDDAEACGRPVAKRASRSNRAITMATPRRVPTAGNAWRNAVFAVPQYSYDFVDA